MKITVCKDCVRRHVGCHTTCKEYIEEKSKFEERKKLIQNENRGRYELFEHRTKAINTALKRKH